MDLAIYVVELLICRSCAGLHLYLLDFLACGLSALT
jgi:hypothetical protein